MALTTQIRANVTAQMTKTGDLGNPAATLILNFLDTLEDGVTNLNADLAYGATETIAASGNTVLDFGTGGGLVDPFGDPFEPVEMVLLFVYAATANTNNVVIGANASEPFLMGLAGTTPTEAVKPGGFWMSFAPAGFAVVNNTNDKLKFLNSAGGTPVDFSILAIGRSA